MKYSVLAISKEPENLNIGDYIQALASSQFLPSLNSFVEREELKSYDEEDVKIIMNGWFMHHPDQWPPSPKIHPLFVATHINLLAQKQMLIPEGIEYFKKHAPIGCRDRYTAQILNDHGIDAYFSGCMTLTLGNNYYNPATNKNVYFVDADVFDVVRRHEYLPLLGEYLLHFVTINAIFAHFKNFEGNVCEEKTITKKLAHYTRKWLRSIKFYKIYSAIFSDEILKNSNFICQQSEQYYYKYPTNKELFACAERLVKQYAKASLVVTSRIHCALPSLGLSTPTLYIYDDKQSEVSNCRLNGLLELFNTVHIHNNKLYSHDIDLKKGKISYVNIPKNKETWKKYADSLSETCKNWVNGNNK